jgi:hypothetical protein
MILSFVYFYCYAECHCNERPYAECRYAERRYAECGGVSRWRLERTPRRFPDWGVANEKLIATFDEKKKKSKLLHFPPSSILLL